jgi:hypothetical protein
MTKKILVLSFILFLSVNLCAQVTIGGLSTPKAGALLDLNSTIPGGLLLSNVDLDDLGKIPATGFVGISAVQDCNLKLSGMIVYNTNAATGIGIHVWDGEDWIKPCAPPAPGAITFSETKICGSTFTAKIDSVKGATSYVWTLPQGLTGISSDTIITINGAVGTYAADSITVRAVSSCGGGTRRRASTQSVEVVERPATPTGASSNSGNSGNQIAFSATPPIDCEIDWYSVPTGGSKIASGASYSEILTATKVYYAESRNTVTGCVSASRLAVTGTVKIYDTCITSSLVLNASDVEFISETTYSRNTITLSAPVKITVSKTNFDGGSSPTFKADYRDHIYGTNTYGSWFSWCMVVQYGNVLCPSPWKVPSKDDFVTYAGSDTDIKSGVDGWQLGGYAADGSTGDLNSHGYYWSSTLIDVNQAYAAHVYGGWFEPQDYRNRYGGFQLRCVK